MQLRTHTGRMFKNNKGTFIKPLDLLGFPLTTKNFMLLTAALFGGKRVHCFDPCAWVTWVATAAQLQLEPGEDVWVGMYMHIHLRAALCFKATIS